MIRLTVMMAYVTLYSTRTYIYKCSMSHDVLIVQEMIYIYTPLILQC